MGFYGLLLYPKRIGLGKGVLVVPFFYYKEPPGTMFLDNLENVLKKTVYDCELTGIWGFR